jgi:hypothetical protein
MRAGKFNPQRLKPKPIHQLRHDRSRALIRILSFRATSYVVVLFIISGESVIKFV